MRRYWELAIQSKEHDEMDPTETGLLLKSKHKIKLSQQNDISQQLHKTEKVH